MKKVTILTTLIFSFIFSYSQESIDSINSQVKKTTDRAISISDSIIAPLPKKVKIALPDTGTLILVKDPNFDLLLQEYLEQKKVKGYKIQLFAGNKRLDALKIKVDFMKLYPNIIPDIIYQQPNYKVRLGNFRNRLEAHKDLMLYKIDFPTAFIIKDEIKSTAVN